MPLIEITNNTINSFLDSLNGKLLNPSELTKKIAGTMLDAVEENFEHQGIPRWTPLAPSTLKRKKTNTILQESGTLASSIHKMSNDKEAVIGTNVVYAAIQHFGGEIIQYPRTETFVRLRYSRGAKKGKFKKGRRSGKGIAFGTRKIIIPSRPYLMLSDSYVEEIKTTILDFYVSD